MKHGSPGAAPTRRLLALLAPLLLILAPGSTEAQLTPLSLPLQRAGFERILQKDGVTVYSHPASKVMHFAAEAPFAYTPAEVQQVLLDYKRQVGQIGRLSAVRVLRRNPAALVVYLRLNLPVVSDRDYTLRTRWEQRGEMRRIFFRATRQGPKPRKGVVRMPLNQGSWQLTPTRGGRGTLARYQLKMDIGGWIPTWLVRRSAGKELIVVIGQFRRMLAAARERARKARTLRRR